MCLAEEESVSGWTCRMRTEKMLWLCGFNMHVGVNVQRLYLFSQEERRVVPPAAGVLVQVRAGEALIALASSQKPPGFLGAANLDPHQVWFKRRKE